MIAHGSVVGSRFSSPKKIIMEQKYHSELILEQDIGINPQSQCTAVDVYKAPHSTQISLHYVFCKLLIAQVFICCIVIQSVTWLVASIVHVHFCSL